jgi:hypothetical protein
VRTNRFAKARPRRTPGTMNKLENQYGDELALLGRAGKIVSWSFEAVTLKLAPDTRYTPDFMVVNADSEIEFHEVKGFMEDDAWVKLKVAAERFPEFHFVLIRRKSKKDGGGWDIRRIGNTKEGE